LWQSGGCARWRRGCGGAHAPDLAGGVRVHRPQHPLQLLPRQQDVVDRKGSDDLFRCRRWEPVSQRDGQGLAPFVAAPNWANRRVSHAPVMKSLPSATSSNTCLSSASVGFGMSSTGHAGPDRQASLSPCGIPEAQRALRERRCAQPCPRAYQILRAGVTCSRA